MDKRTNKLIKIVLLLLIFFLFFRVYKELVVLTKIVINFFLPFIIGFTIAFLLNPFVDKLESKGCNRKIISCVFVLGIAFIIFLSFYYFVPTIVEEGNKLLDNMPIYIENIESVINKFTKKFSKVNLDIGIKQQYFPIIMNYFVKIIQSTFSYIISFVIGLILSLYFLIDYHKIITKLKDYLVFKKKENMLFLLRELNKTMYAYFKGIIFVMIILSITSTLCFLLIGLDMPYLWGIVIGLTNIIPYIGPYIGGIIVGFFTLSSAPSKLAYVIVTVVVLQIIESNFVTPAVESKTVKTHPIIVILFMMLFSEMFGVLGLLLAVPILSILQSSIKWQKSN